MGLFSSNRIIPLCKPVFLFVFCSIFLFRVKIKLAIVLAMLIQSRLVMGNKLPLPPFQSSFGSYLLGLTGNFSRVLQEIWSIFLKHSVEKVGCKIRDIFKIPLSLKCLVLNLSKLWTRCSWYAMQNCHLYTDKTVNHEMCGGKKSYPSILIPTCSHFPTFPLLSLLFPTHHFVSTAVLVFSKLLSSQDYLWPV